MIRRYFFSTLAAAMAPLFTLGRDNVLLPILNIVDYRTAVGRKSNLGGTARSRYMPHQGNREIERRRKQIERGSLRVTGSLPAADMKVAA